MIAPALIAIGSTLAQLGMDALGDLFKTGTAAAKELAVDKIEELTGVSREKLATGDLTDQEAAAVKACEPEVIKTVMQSLFAYMTEADKRAVEMRQEQTKDLHDARQAQSQRTGAKWWMMPVVMTGLIVFLCAFIWHAAFGEIKEPTELQKLVITTGIGFATGIIVAYVNYLVGSSQGSKDKDNDRSAFLNKVVDKMKMQ